MNESLLAAAVEARRNAYAPYSSYRVGAAILDSEGDVWTGCNVENVSYGLSICAERSAVCKMVGEGRLQLKGVAVATRDGGLPCGMCLQTLIEFAPDPTAVFVDTISESGDRKRYVLSDLIPFGFKSDDLKRT